MEKLTTRLRTAIWVATLFLKLLCPFSFDILRYHLISSILVCVLSLFKSRPITSPSDIFHRIHTNTPLTCAVPSTGSFGSFDQNQHWPSAASCRPTCRPTHHASSIIHYPPPTPLTLARPNFYPAFHLELKSLTTIDSSSLSIIIHSISLFIAYFHTYCQTHFCCRLNLENFQSLSSCYYFQRNPIHDPYRAIYAYYAPVWTAIWHYRTGFRDKYKKNDEGIFLFWQLNWLAVQTFQFQQNLIDFFTPLLLIMCRRCRYWLHPTFFCSTYPCKKKAL